LANIYGVYDAIDGVFGLEAAKDMNEQTPTETLEQAMWHLFVHTAHDVCPDINEQDLETVLRSSPAIFDMAAGTVMRTIRLRMLSAEHSRPDRDHPDEQRETDERRCFVGDCEQDGIAGVNSAEVIQHAPGIWARGPVMIPAGATATAATAGEAQTTLEARWPGDSLHKTERT
jgi:hypothetical protein